MSVTGVKGQLSTKIVISFAFMIMSDLSTCCISYKYFWKGTIHEDNETMTNKRDFPRYSSDSLRAVRSRAHAR